MRSSLIATRNLKLIPGPSLRGDATRRRWTVAGALVGLALAGGLFGYLTAPAGPSDVRTGPFSYFPSD